MCGLLRRGASAVAARSAAAFSVAAPPRCDPLSMATSILHGDRGVLARAVTLVESTLDAHRAEASVLLDALLGVPNTAATFRVGIAGPPGAGKSTLIEALGLHILASAEDGGAVNSSAAHGSTAGASDAPRVAVLAIDPSSSRTGGSLLGDKTRMGELSRHPRAFVRPSPTRGTLGGVARATHEAAQLCERAGFGTVLVETVGLGQSEIAVDDVVDVLLLVLAPGAGDELQGAKKGIIECSDVICVNKADGAGAHAAKAAAAEYTRAMQLVRAKHRGGGWEPRVLTASAVSGAGVPELWAALCDARDALSRSGTLAARRRHQAVQWMWADFDASLVAAAHADPAVAAAAARLTPRLAAGQCTPRVAASELLAAFR